MSGQTIWTLRGLSVIFALGYMTPTHAMTKESAAQFEEASARAETELVMLDSSYQSEARARLIDEAATMVAPEPKEEAVASSQDGSQSNEEPTAQLQTELSDLTQRD